MAIQIVGFSSSYKVPGFFGETVYGAGAISQGSIPLTLLVVGLKSSAGAMTPDSTPVDIFSAEDADAQAGPGSELARKCYVALKYPGIRLKAACPGAASGAVAASATITVTGTATTSGEWEYRVAGETISGGIATGDLAADVAADIAAAINSRPRLPVTASVGGGGSNVVTLPVKSPGIRGNDYILHQVTTRLASGITSAIAGGSSVTGGRVKFAGGSGTEDVTTLLSVLLPGWYHRIAIAQNDATNLARWKSHSLTKAGPLEGRMEHYVVAGHGALSASQSLSTITLNYQRFQNAWLLNSESHPSEIAASLAALRTITEQDDPDAAYDDVQLLGIAPQAVVADWPNASTQSSALDNGVTPLTTTPDGRVVVVRSITTRCLNGSDPDYRTLDTSDAVVPDYVRRGLQLIWTTEFKANNPRVADDPAEGQRDRPAGVATPTRWAQRATKYLKDLEGASPPILIDVETNPVIAEYNRAAKRIMAVVPVVPAPNQHQIGVSVRQQA